ncbi:hypothetical protein [Comamonas testosteroni]|uniref:hypothetical protein n=1 Tax=Comamonas testosteroni TaxID=285 RepID=UPI000682754F|nr:hypothetical protein [Comamonas testosteroni]
MPTPKGQVQREGKVSFGDASLSIWEESIPTPTRDFKERDAWELAFKRQVFARIVQTLNRLGWTCVVPESYIKQYSLSFARDRRECHKGDLKGFLDVSGRSITFEMWQGVNTPTRPDHGGRYESNKEACMPYLLRLEMERTRRRIRDYLCNVFSHYEFESKKRTAYDTPLQFTAMEKIEQRYAESCNFRGDMQAYLKSCGHTELPSYNCTSADKQRLQHGQKVWTTDWHGRWVEGTALYNINNMWWVVLGKYDYTNKASFDLHTVPPPDVRRKSNERQRRKRLEVLLGKAAKSMNFARAEQLKKVLWPVPEPLFMIEKEGAYFGPNYCGYTSDPVTAGKYVASELKPYADQFASGVLKAIPLAASASH